MTLSAQRVLAALFACWVLVPAAASAQDRESPDDGAAAEVAVPGETSDEAHTVGASPSSLTLLDEEERPLDGAGQVLGRLGLGLLGGPLFGVLGGVASFVVGGIVCGLVGGLAVLIAGLLGVVRLSFSLWGAGSGGSTAWFVDLVVACVVIGTFVLTALGAIGSVTRAVTLAGALLSARRSEMGAFVGAGIGAVVGLGVAAATLFASGGISYLWGSGSGGSSGAGALATGVFAWLATVVVGAVLGQEFAVGFGKYDSKPWQLVPNFGVTRDGTAVVALAGRF